MKKQADTIIVGQGIAGSLVAFMLYKQKIPFIVIDGGHSNTASSIAAGMFSSISGKRNTINPLLSDQIPFAINIYKEIEQLLGQSILHTQNIYHVPESIEQKNDLIEKSKKETFEKYIIADPAYMAGIKQEFGAIEITGSGWVDCPLFIHYFKNWLKEKELLIQEIFDYDKLSMIDKVLTYNDIEFKNIIFCEGYRAASNPFFKDENIIPCKGDILTIAYENGPYGHIIKKNACYLIPFGKNTFKAGSTYQWDNHTETLDDANRKEIEDKVSEILEQRHSVINHQSAIRPTTKNREVIAKRHSGYPNLYMLNGLGTKGVIQGPWWADHLVKLLQKSKS